MADIPDVRFTGLLSGSDFERLLANAVASEIKVLATRNDGPMEDLLKEIRDQRDRGFTDWQNAKLEIEKIRDSYKSKEEQSRKDVENANNYIETKIEALKEKINKQANTIFLPVASIVLLAGLIGLWVLVGSNVFELRRQVDDSLGKVADFNTKITKAQQDLAAAQTDFNTHKQQIDQAISGTLAAELTSKLNLVQQDLTGIHAAVTSLQNAHIATAVKNVPTTKPTKP
jgi:hypothetical protein